MSFSILFLLRKPLLSLLFLLLFAPAYPQLTLVKDVDNDLFDPQTSGMDASGLTDINGVLYFSGRSDKGYELWKSDGVTTSLVKDIHPGTTSSNPLNLTNINGILYFIANDGFHGPSLFTSDGSTEGTLWIKSLPSATFTTNEGIYDSSPHFSFSAENLIYMVIQRTDNKSDLWRSDGTSEGTYILHSYTFNVNTLLKSDFAVIGNTILFRGFYNNQEKLWRSDGTIEGTMAVNVTDGLNLSASYLTVIGSEVYFRGNNNVYGQELWKTDGTDAGTQMVKDINPGIGSSIVSAILNFNGKALFYINTTTAVRGIWLSDGTEDGTELISTDGFFGYATVVGNSIFSVSFDYVSFKYSLYRWDGTTRTSNLVRIMPSSVSQLMKFNDLLYFTATTGDLQGAQIWKSDGTATGTIPITNFPYFMQTGSLFTQFLTKSGDNLYFTCDSGAETGNELWKTDGTVGNLTQLTDFPKSTYGGYYTGLTAIKGKLYFAGASKAFGLEPWISDGTTQGTRLLKDIKPGDQYSSSLPSNFTEGDNQVFFTTNNNLWKTDGTTTGTVALNTTFSSAANLIYINNTLYFRTYNAGQGAVNKLESPYITSQQVQAFGQATELVVHKNEIYFVSKNLEGYFLGKYIPQESRMEVLKQFSGGASSIYSANDFIFFKGNDTVHGSALWKTDGTPQGTVMVRDIHPGTGDAQLSNFISRNGVLYFFADDDVNGVELWKSDGTDKGTSMVKDIRPGVQSSTVFSIYGYRKEMVADDLYCYFSADDGVHGTELWRSDGTSEGTKMIMDINPGGYSSSPFNLLINSGALYFTAYDNTTRTLWKTTGSECGILKVTSNTTVIAGGETAKMAVMNETLFITGYSRDAGDELRMHVFANDLPMQDQCKRSQEITFAPLPEKQWNNVPFQLSASASSGLPVVFTTSTPDIIEINGNTVTLIKPGVATIIASQEGNSNFSLTTLTREMIVNKIDQTITFANITNHELGSSSLQLDVTSDSGLPLSYQSSSNVSISLGKASWINAGRAKIEAQQSGNEFYKEAIPVSKSFCINPASPLLTLKENGADAVISFDNTSGTEVHWFLNGNIIEDEHQMSLLPVASGIYTCLVMTDDCSSSPSKGIDFIVTGLQELAEGKLIFYPNPTTNQLNIKVATGSQKTIHIIDTQGKVVLSRVTSEFITLDTSELPAGIYLISVKNGDHQEFGKLVIH